MASSTATAGHIQRGKSFVQQSVLLIYHPSMEILAKQTAEAGKPHIELFKMSWEFFEDGFPNLFIPNVRSIAGRDVCFLSNMMSPAIVFEQLSVIYELPRYQVRTFKLVLPYFPTGTMERIDHEGQIATAKSLTRVLSAIPLTSHGPSEIVIFDIHALGERFYFTDQILPRLESAIPLLLKRLSALPDVSDVSIAFPDEGAYKRFHASFKDYDTIICQKIRDGNDRLVTIKDGNCTDRHIVIVDDLVKTGGTLLQCAKALKQHGAKSISIYVSHGVFPQDSWKRFLSEDFCYVWVTDSCPDVLDHLRGRKPFEILSLAPILADVL